MEISQLQYHANHSTFTNAYLYQKGPYTPDDYSIPPDEESDNDYYSDTEYNLPIVKVEPYPFTPGTDKSYRFESFVNSEYYQSIDPRADVWYSSGVKRRCLEGNVFKNL